MSSMNKVILIGRLGRDPETRYMPNGDAVCNFSVATSESWNDKTSGNKVERTEWHNITIYGRTAEVAGKYLKKGSLVYLEGRIQSRKYTDKTGVERTAYEIIANEMRMLGSKNDRGSDVPYDSQPAAAPAYQSQNNYDTDAPPPAAPQARKAPVAPVAPVEGIDDDIPF